MLDMANKLSPGFYLHTTSKSFTDGLAFYMFQYRSYVIIPPAHAAN